MEAPTAVENVPIKSCVCANEMMGKSKQTMNVYLFIIVCRATIIALRNIINQQDINIKIMKILNYSPG